VFGKTILATLTLTRICFKYSFGVIVEQKKNHFSSRITENESNNHGNVTSIGMQMNRKLLNK